MTHVQLDLTPLEEGNKVDNALEYINTTLERTIALAPDSLFFISRMEFEGYFNISKGLVVCTVSIPLRLRSDWFAGSGVVKHWRENRWMIEDDRVVLFHSYTSGHKHDEDSMRKEWEEGMEEMVYACIRHEAVNNLDKYDLVNLLKYKGHKVLTDWMLSNEIERAKVKAEKKAIKKILADLKKSDIQ